MNLHKTGIFLLSLALPALVAAQGVDMLHVAGQDTIDEEDLFRMRDTLQLSRRNVADKEQTVNTLDYVLRDVYTPHSHSFDSHWYDHIYMGGGFSMEMIRKQAKGHTFNALTGVSAYVGKDFDRKNSLRLSVGGAWGYQNETNESLTQVRGRLDYLFNLSSHFQGYNPARRMEIALMAGAGLTYAHLKRSSAVSSSVGGSTVSPEVHAGLQLKCVTGPLGTLNIEPYVGVAHDDTDVSSRKNWRGYDLFYGLNVNYGFYLADNLSEEARHAILQARLADDRMVDPQTLERWRTPWFVEFADGIAFASSSELGFGSTLGHETSVSVGRWLSPVIGARATATMRSTRRYERDITGQEYTASDGIASNGNYLSGRLEALFNPMGFSKDFSWSAPWGGYLVFGGEVGRITHYSQNATTHYTTIGYDIGVHMYHRLSEDLQLFIEPRYSHNLYPAQTSSDMPKVMRHQNNVVIDMGLTLLIRSKRFEILDEMDDTQNYTYRDIRGPRVGIAGGMPLLQRKREYYTGLGMNWNGMAFVEYRFNHLHTLRLQGDLMSLKGWTNSTVSDSQLPLQRTNRLLLASLDYEVSLTNLASGRFHNRPFELEGYVGPTMGIRLSTGNGDKCSYGFNVGLKLAREVWRGISVFASPTVYFLNSSDGMEDVKTVHIGGMQMMQTLSIGVQYKIGSLHRNAEVLRRRRADADKRWELKQLRKQAETEAMQTVRLKAKKARYKR